jgi:DnaJ-class molecular chaperone
MKKQKAITSDLFECVDCKDCKATGQIETTPKNSNYEDCENCNGTGIQNND